MEPQAFRRLLNTYTLAGAEGVHVTLHPHPGDPEVLQQATAAITSLRPDSGAALTVADNRVTDPAADIEIHRGSNGRWYPFASSGHERQLTALHARARPRR
ncbi:hypothetical protein [Nonomuraea sp. NPDC049684]|uniref:hypothetical protein n=1 Tax=Nonomuraea sp. NPDC049684 TaxID=3364356 RepID=UPI00379B0962